MYGSTEEVARSVRLFREGLLKFEPCNNGQECLPFANVSTCLGPSRKCALAGTLTLTCIATGAAKSRMRMAITPLPLLLPSPET